MKIFDTPVTLEQALREAGEDWVPVPTALFVPDANNHLELLPHRIGLRRSDTGRFIPGIAVSTSYTIVPVKDAFLVVDKLVGAGEAVIQRVGSQYGGRFQWLSAKLPRAISLQLDDQTDRLEKSLLFCTSHDTSSSVVVRFGLRKNDDVMCNFTSQEIRIQHRGNAQERMAKIVGHMVEISGAFFQVVEKKLSELTETGPDDDQIFEFSKRLFPVKDKLTANQLTRIDNHRAQLVDVVRAYEDSPGGTTWYGMYLASQRFLQGRIKSRTQDSLWKSTFRGNIARQKVRAFDLVVELSKVRKPNWQLRDELLAMS